MLGEFGARQLFLNWLHDKERTEAAAAGWRGDRYLVYQQNKATSYVWKIVCRDAPSAQRFYDAVRDSNVARYRWTHDRETRPAPFAGAGGNVEEPRCVASLTALPPGRRFELCLTSAHEIIVIDAQESLSAALGERFAPGIHFPEP